MLGGVRGRLAARSRELIDGAGCLGEQVEQLEPDGAGECLAQSDSIGRKPLIAAGMLRQAAALTALALSGGRVAIAAGSGVLLGLGTALVYPTLIAAMSDAVSPVERAPIVGVYRLWPDSGYALGALIAGASADALGYGGAIAIVAALTAASGLWVLADMPRSQTVASFSSISFSRR